MPVVAYEVACGSAALASMAAASEDATPIARMAAKEYSILTFTDMDGSYSRRKRRVLVTRGKLYLYLCPDPRGIL